MTNLLGFTDQESGKTMALAAIGPEPLVDPDRLFDVDEERLTVTSGLARTHQVGARDWFTRQGIQLPNDFHATPDEAAAIAAAAQEALERTLLRLVSAAVQVTGLPNVCMSGGVALNCVANARLRDDRKDGHYFMPAASDCGLPLGNALFGHHCLSGELPRPKDRSFRYGPRHSKSDIVRALQRVPATTPPAQLQHGDLRWRRSADPVGDALDLLVRGGVIGWFQGPSEYGPRALGARSILTLPNPNAQARLNHIKRREWFRPFGPSLLRRLAPTVLADSMADGRYMAESARCTPVGRDLLAGAVHVDGTARVQLVDEGTAHERFVELLARLESANRAPAIVNTSFNRNEPLVETPGQAVRTFLSAGLDALILEDHVATIERW